MKLARAVHLDESDMLVFARPARTGEWAISGGFAFSNIDAEHITGKLRQAFANGFLGLETFGRVTFVAVTPILPSELAMMVENLALHFMDHYGAPDQDVARRVADEELSHMLELCAGHDDNTLITVERELGSQGVHERFRVVAASQANLHQFAVHGEAE
jgi:hypothetical protein